MGKVTGIGWTDHTFNPWWGCVKVSPGCKLCYAERQASRTGHDVWGPEAPRRMFRTDGPHFMEPFAWDKAARLAGVRRRVFCGSMCDILEERTDLDESRMALWDLVQMTPNLLWLLLTKRSHRLKAMPRAILEADNVMVGVSVESQEYVDRVSDLLASGARAIFLSCEPLLGPLDLRLHQNDIDWVIVGGESQPGCRPMDEAWARAIVQECQDNSVAVFVKQLGGHPDSRKDPADWPVDLRIQEFAE